MAAERHEPTAAQKAMSACAGAVVTSLTVTPLDVVKTRQQLWEAPAFDVSAAEDALGACAADGSCALKRSGGGGGSARLPSSLALYPRCTHYEVFHGGLCETLRPKGRDFWRPPPPAAAAYQLNTAEMFIAIARHEGLPALWQGLGPALTMSLPSTVLYMTVYDELRSRLQRSDDRALAAWAPLISGIASRSFAAAAVSPIELIRTQMQSGQWESGVGLVGGLRRTRALHGVGGLYRGLVPTLLRDIPFSGLYWTLYEASRARAADVLHWSPFAASFAAGAGSGMVAACVTTPCDVVKTRMQMALYAGAAAGGSGPVEHAARGGLVSAHGAPPVSALGTLLAIVRDDGMLALCSGMVSRMAKVAPACAIMISSYEMGKRFFTS
ncbi:hypothetical protein KFE25_012038 [Diacronema lutheri]|uniref:Uncharacterized protein n=1 Tax=Diacronema lutheri TaxID=2081491 RepID=A0A8J6CC72_DIALT|nr:hypothetical protein KFE25_001036 [Diacronema lutheri]KAG8462218.1 hypothetical protein KFE25_012038 [Diacronema lutheri]